MGGKEEANKAIDDFELTDYGWKHEKIGVNVMSNRHRKGWTKTDTTKLTRMYKSGRLSVEKIAQRLDRTPYAIVKKASRLNLRFNKRK
ncbi:MAG: hypothetical protein ACTSV7_04565 [Candidatus Baldrarchaeia archaeon]